MGTFWEDMYYIRRSGPGSITEKLATIEDYRIPLPLMTSELEIFYDQIGYKPEFRGFGHLKDTIELLPRTAISSRKSAEQINCNKQNDTNQKVKMITLSYGSKYHIN